MRSNRSTLPFLLLLSFGTLTARGADESPSLPAAPPPELTLAAAVARALANDPALRAVDEQLAAVDGQIEQARRRPNPVVSGEFENFLGTGPLRGVDGLEITLGARQLIETAHKREKRTAAAQAEREVVAWEREARVYEVRAGVRQEFVALLLAQQATGLNEDLLALARESERETARLLEAARVPEVELSRARLAVRQRAFALQQARQAVAAARTRLAARWGDPDPAPFRAAGALRLEESLPALAELAGLLPRTAPLARYDAVATQRQRTLELEQARARPDVEVFAGGRYTREGDAAALVAGIDIPWPMFDRNQGNIRTAQAELRAVEHERAAVRRTLLQQLADAHARLVAAHAEAASVQRDLQPAAEQTLASTEDLYERGQYSLLHVLDARQTLFAIRETYLDALLRYAEAQAEIEALTQPVAPPQP